MGVIGIWLDGLQEELAGVLVGAGHAVEHFPAGEGLDREIVALVADAAVLAAQAGKVAQWKARRGATLLPVLAVLPVAADEAAVAATLALADEVIRRPVGAAELTARVGRLLAAREQLLRVGELAACCDRTETALAAAVVEHSRRLKELHCLSEVHAVIQRFGQPREELFRGVAALIPPAMRRPGAALARILADGVEYASPGFRPGPHRLAFSLAGSGQPEAALEVHYDALEGAAEPDPFDADETALVRLVAQRLDRTMARLGAEAALARERDFSALLMDTLPGGLLRLDRTGAMLFSNPRAEAILELEGRNLAAVPLLFNDPGFAPADLEGRPLAAAELPFARVMATGRPVYDMALSIVRPGSGRRFLSVSAAPLFSQDGGVEEVVVSIVDVSEHKAMERQLAHALKMESLGQLAAGIAHEINTPVQYVGGNLEFLGNTFGRLLELLDTLAATALEDRDDLGLAQELTRLLGDEELRFLLEEAPAAIRESKEGLDRVAAIVASMKRFAHPGVERPQPVDLAQAVSDTLAVSRSAWRFAADVAVDIDAGLPPILFVPGDFNQVLLNIVVNAAEAIEEKYQAHGGKGHIAIRAARSGSCVELAISDDGAGIPEAVRPRIFDPFFTTKPVGRGTGQGLAIVHTILDRHRTRLEVLTTPGEGTSFVLTLPVAEQAVLGY